MSVLEALLLLLLSVAVRWNAIKANSLPRTSSRHWKQMPLKCVKTFLKSSVDLLLPWARAILFRLKKMRLSASAMNKVSSIRCRAMRHPQRLPKYAENCAHCATPWNKVLVRFRNCKHASSRLRIATMHLSEQSTVCKQNSLRQNRLLVFFDLSWQLLSKNETLQRMQAMLHRKAALWPNVVQREHLLV